MDRSGDLSKRIRAFGWFAAGSLFILGMFCVGGVLVPVVKGYLNEGTEAFSVFFLIVVLMSALIFAVYCLVIARALCKGLTKESLRNVCLIFSLTFYLILGSVAVSVLRLERLVPESIIWIELSQILCMIPAGLFYWFSIKYFTRWLGFDTSIDWKKREKAAKRYFGLMALFLWGFLLLLAINLEEAYSFDYLLFPWSIGVLLLPVILTFTFYRLSVRVAMRGRCKCHGETSEGEDIIYRAE